jgi:hypothetical protein
MNLPKMATITQRYDASHIRDVEQETRSTIERSGLLKKIKKGDRVAVGVGSRGIAGLAKIVSTVCRLLAENGGEPFIFPAMGSHGGGTSKGQEQVLHALGISRETAGAGILSDANGELAGETEEGIPVYVDRYAKKAAHVVVINRIKPHTKFKGPIESGILKMLSVGMGKAQGAAILHRSAVEFGFPRVIRSVGQKALQILPFLFAVAIIENPYKKIHSLSLLTKDTIREEEKLLEKASAIMPRIPFEKFDLLIVDEIGKDISGTGMDTNVTGRNRDILGVFNIFPKIHRIFVRDLTEKTGGNANGIGFADFTTRRLVDKIDFKKTYTNALTAMSPEKAAIPVTMANDREAIEAALDSIGFRDGKEAKILRIKNTSELTLLQISEALLPLPSEIKGARIEITGQPEAMSFDADGFLL